MDKQTELTGRVTFKTFSAGSKSEHEAAYLTTEHGSYALRRIGGNPFSDKALEQFNGKTVTVTGYISNYIFFFSKISIQKQ